MHSFSDEVIDHEISTLSRDDFLQINVHSLGMPLEKIDEDDPASGGTNSSSTDTPDTETVIDIFPSDVPPLPMDNECDTAQQEVQYEDSQSYDAQSTKCREEEENVDLNRVSEEEYLQATENTYREVEHDMTDRKVYEDDNELCDDNELAESADQLSPLDVIDQMELRLMQELEQQALEDYADESNEQLEAEVSRQLLYLSDDADFIDDLDVPRNVVPPSEPPPPPPPEQEKVDKVNPFQRINSTKRIKKEIWRRRSDFLGLDSPSGINVDDLPPPPPGLEELLKSEMELQREQRLYMEKHLSLADSDYASATETLNSLTDSTTFSPSKEYTAEYMMEVLDAEVFDAVPTEYSQSETWIVEECQSPVSDLGIQETSSDKENSSKHAETAQQKAKNHIHSLGAAPRAKIMDSNKWITQAERHAPLAKRTTVDPLVRDGTYTQNFWLAQEADRKGPVTQTTSRTAIDRRYSMPPAYGSKAPDVTVRTWSDRESEYQQQPRPKSGAWPDSSAAQQPQYPSSNSSDYYHNRSSSWTESTNGVEESTNQYEVGHQCSYCGQVLTEGSAMGIDALQLYFHIECFRCCMCELQLGNGSCGTDVQVKNSQLYCPKCFALD